MRRIAASGDWCCPMCHSADYPDRTEPQRRRRERRRAKLAARNWAMDY
ncbi:hypothetical protein JF780_12190 [Mycobacterium intracellulare]|nr:hypothetical protein [Mycobacterium intracellulare]MCA2325726.1 hypothetical protein [Mycobacterium intracellulare]